MYKITRNKIALNESTSCLRSWSFSVTIECDDKHHDADVNVLIYHTHPENSVNGEDPFVGVATLAQMSTIPVLESKEIADSMEFTKNIPFYRTSTVTFDCTNAIEAERIWTMLKVRIQQLVNEYKCAENLKDKEEVII